MVLSCPQGPHNRPRFGVADHRFPTPACSEHPQGITARFDDIIDESKWIPVPKILPAKNDSRGSCAERLFTKTCGEIEIHPAP
jgi:hypothetical protein